jgi:hypothetical protein
VSMYARPQLPYPPMPGSFFAPPLHLPFGTTSPAQQLFYGFAADGAAYEGDGYLPGGMGFLPMDVSECSGCSWGC